MRVLIYRHLKLFLKNPFNILLSFLSSLVIISLYFLFIRDFTIQAVSDYGFVSSYNELFVDRLMTSGLLIVVGATSVLSIVFIFVKDYCSGIIKDFMVSPVSYIKIIYSYFFASFIVSMVITLLVYLGIQVFFGVVYEDVNSFSTTIFSVFILFLSNIISSLLMLIVGLFIRSFTSFSTFETLYGVVIGFFTGVYIPIGYYPTLIKNIFFYFPLCQTTSLLRNIQTSVIVDKILDSYPKSQHDILYNTFGVHLTFCDVAISLKDQLVIVIVAIILLNFIVLFIIYLRRYHKIH